MDLQQHALRIRRVCLPRSEKGLQEQGVKLGGFVLQPLCSLEGFVGFKPRGIELPLLEEKQRNRGAGVGNQLLTVDGLRRWRALSGNNPRLP